MKKLLSVLSVFLILLMCVGCGTEKTDANESRADAENMEEYEKTFKALTEKYKSNGHPIAVMITNNGNVVMELYEDKAPNTVANFVFLANKGFYDGLIFHRCIQDFMIQGGDPQGTGSGGPGYMIKGEFADNGLETGLEHKRGTLSMARRGRGTGSISAYDTAGSQFFICVADYPSLDGQYAAFGNVLEGMETVDKIVSQKTDSNDKPLTSQIIKYLRVETYGLSNSEPETVSED